MILFTSKRSVSIFFSLFSGIRFRTSGMHIDNCLTQSVPSQQLCHFHRGQPLGLQLIYVHRGHHQRHGPLQDLVPLRSVLYLLGGLVSHLHFVPFTIVWNSGLGYFLQLRLRDLDVCQRSGALGQLPGGDHQHSQPCLYPCNWYAHQGHH